MTILGDKIRQRREWLGRSQLSMADKARLTAQAWSMFEIGHLKARNPTVTTLRDMGYALGLSPLALAAAAFEDLLNAADVRKAKVDATRREVS
jgi:transcriptional regulator with XRE-family HTH domain